MSTLMNIIQQITKRVRQGRSLPVGYNPPTKKRAYKDASSPSAGTVLPRYFADPLVEDNEELVIVEDYTKQCLLAICAYHDYIDKFTNEHQDNPEFMQRVNSLMQLIENDRPVKKKLVIETFNDLFKLEYADMYSEIPAAERYKHLGLPETDPNREIIEEQTEILIYEHRASQVTHAEYVKLDNKSQNRLVSYKASDDANRIFSQRSKTLNPREIHNRFYYVFNQIKVTFAESADIVDDYSEKMGNVMNAMNYILLKEKRTEGEQKVMDGFQYVCRLMLEHQRYSRAVYLHHQMNFIEPFPMSDFLRKRFLDCLSGFLTNRYIPDEIRALRIPDQTHKRLLDQRIREQKAIDYDALFQKDLKSAAKLIEEKGDGMLVRRDLVAKDEQLIRKMNILADSLEIKKQPKIELDFGLGPPETLKAELKERMTVDANTALLSTDNLVKLIYLNNADPDQFNLEYWAETFNMTPQKLKNIVYNFSIPIMGEHSAEYKLDFIEKKPKGKVVDLEKEHLKSWKLS